MKTIELSSKYLIFIKIDRKSINLMVPSSLKLNQTDRLELFKKGTSQVLQLCGRATSHRSADAAASLRHHDAVPRAQAPRFPFPAFASRGSVARDLKLSGDLADQPGQDLLKMSKSCSQRTRRNVYVKNFAAVAGKAGNRRIVIFDFRSMMHPLELHASIVNMCPTAQIHPSKCRLACLVDLRRQCLRSSLPPTQTREALERE